MTNLLVGLMVGLGLGATYVLIAVSYTLVLGVSGVFNFAQGTSVMLGTVLAFAFSVTFHVHWLAAVASIAAVGMLFGFITHLVAVRSVAGRLNDWAEAGIMSTLGLGLAVESIVADFFDVTPRQVPSYVSSDPVWFGNVPVQPIYIWIFCVAVVVVGLLELVMRRTPAGTILRATLEDPQGAQVVGIRVVRVAAIVFVVAGALSAIVGFLIAPVTFASPFVGDNVGLYAFVAMGIGGFGSFGGALVGGMLVGILEGIIPVFLGPNAVVPLLFCLIVVVLVARPVGLLGSRGYFGNEKLREV
jgi:branched-subunit amino acid ABC-type transport system permease component